MMSARVPSRLSALAGAVKVLATCKEHQTIFVRGRRVPPHRRPLPVAPPTEQPTKANGKGRLWTPDRTLGSDQSAADGLWPVRSTRSGCSAIGYLDINQR